jgi:cytochrome c-type biogenesis protein CcmH/NrfG
MAVFSTNQRQHPEDKFWTALGLARGYTSTGDKKNAIANWEIVLRNLPNNLSNRAPAYQQALRKLKRKQLSDMQSGADRL